MVPQTDIIGKTQRIWNILSCHFQNKDCTGYRDGALFAPICQASRYMHIITKATPKNILVSHHQAMREGVFFVFLFFFAEYQMGREN